MKRENLTKNGSCYCFAFPARKMTAKAIIIVPNTAGYYASSEKYGQASGHIEAFCASLSEEYNVYYLVLPGQDPEHPKHLYSYEESVKVVANTFIHVIMQKKDIVGVIGMCTGAAIAVSAMQKVRETFPLVIYNTANKVGWNIPKVQRIFQQRYPHVNLDCNSLLSAPMPGEILSKHEGECIQILCGNSDYPVANQIALKSQIPNLEQKEFKTMSDAPIETSEQYSLLIDAIFHFFGVEVKV